MVKIPDRKPDAGKIIDAKRLGALFCSLLISLLFHKRPTVI